MTKGLPWLLWLLWLPAGSLAAAEMEFTFDPAAYERPPWEVGGYLELGAEYLRLNRDATATRLAYRDGGIPDSLNRYRGQLELSGLYRWSQATLHGRAQAVAVDDGFETRNDATINELYAHIPRDDRLSLQAGKRTLRWGNGYAWNPIAFLERPKDPLDPDLTREGFTMASLEHVTTRPGPLQTLAFTPVLLPVSDEINSGFGEGERLNLAARLYMLYRDTDIELTALGNGSRPGSIGMGMARNLAPHFEIHAEMAWFQRREVGVVSADGELATRKADPVDLLIGIRYQTETERTWVVEYFRRGTGYSGTEMEEYHTLAQSANSDPLLQGRLAKARREGYGASQAMRDYLYMRLRQSEPWGALYWGTGVTTLINLQDHSASIIPEVSYTGISNVELRGRLAILTGASGSEFGERLSRWRLELRMRSYF
ncbi:hypothetical protein [Desulfurivibrio sp. C05AmB]|uniref:hypothetical protein n=1 Tax=Desulfurivibrio sp. C05AmB TaxID=3374371 RepID=UPI00376F214A